jgi:HSP20 family protein
MAIRDLIPWSRQENRLPVSSGAQRDRDDHPLLSLHRDVNRLFDDLFRGFGVPSLGGFERSFAWPNVELGETDSEIRIAAELPGLDEKDVELSLEDGVLTLRGEKKSTQTDKERGYSERSYGTFERRLTLPSNVDEDACSADFRDGVLTITLPKTAEKARGRRIPLRRASSSQGQTIEAQNDREQSSLQQAASEPEDRGGQQT